MRDRNLRAKAALTAGLLAGASLGTSLLSASSRAEAPVRGCAGDENLSDIAGGEGTLAISNREVVVIGNRRMGCMYLRPALETGLLRHLAVQEGTGTAFVDDQPGDDRLVVVTPQGTTDVRSGAEIAHPAWSRAGDLAWVADFQGLRVLSGGAVSSIERPAGARAVFAPTFTASGDLVVVGQEKVFGAPGYEDDQLNNLWSLNRATERWTKTTDFAADNDRWSIIRTPLAVSDGSVLFVRVAGQASATRQPRFQLWRSSTEGVRKVRDLPGEMFLAGMRDGRLVWNVFSERCGDWELLVESGSGLSHVGCGAVAVDPVNLKDPDLSVQDEHGEGSLPDDVPVDIGVVVGDFESERQAADVAEEMGGLAVVITNQDAPLAVRPGAYAVARPLAPGAPAKRALAEVRAKLPSLRAKVFIAPLEDFERSGTH